MTLPSKVTGGSVARDAAGKVEITYVGAEYCPYCAAERWAIAVALSRFGTFSNLSGTHSSSSDVYPDTQTLSFYGSTYSSPYVDFQPVEEATNQQVGGTYQALQTPTSAQSALVATYDPEGSIPFLDIANRYVVTGASFSPQVLQGLSRQQIADQLDNPSSPVAQAVDGTANAITAAIVGRDRQPAERGGELGHHPGHREAAGGVTSATRSESRRRGRSGQRGGQERDGTDGTEGQPTAPSGTRDREARFRRGHGGRPSDLALVAVGIASYLTAAHYADPTALACPDTGIVNCALVTTSSWSIVLGVPLAVVGLVWAVAMAALTLPWVWRSPARWVEGARLGLSGAGAAMVLYLVYVELFRIGAICLWCTAMHVTAVCLFGVVLAALAARTGSVVAGT